MLVFNGVRAWSNHAYHAPSISFINAVAKQTQATAATVVMAYFISYRQQTIGSVVSCAIALAQDLEKYSETLEAMGNYCVRSRPSECALCRSQDCRDKAPLCERCTFVRQFVVDHGRNTLRRITVNHDEASRPRALSLPVPPRQAQVTEVRQVWGNSAVQRDQPVQTAQNFVDCSRHPSAPPGYANKY